ncbi:MAG TPA: hypothetical protein VK856_09305, partial [Anaerolineaceae bacterium]|nr:hypothetical protein [Anaerolineaceae bacterium]
MKKLTTFLPLLIILSLILTGCQAAPVQSQDNPIQVPSLETDTPEKISEQVSEVHSTAEATEMSPIVIELTIIESPEPTTNVQSSPTPRPTLGPDDWQELPISPTDISDRMRDVYQQGLAMGNDPTH